MFSGKHIIMKEVADFLIIKKVNLSPNFVLFKLQKSGTLQSIEPGQFVQVKIPGTANVLLRRPISIHDVDAEQNCLSLVIQTVGKGTFALSDLQEGDTMNLVYPLGKGYPIEGTHPLLVGGGCGVAPLLYLARTFYQKNIRPLILLGCKSHVILQEEFARYGDVFITTEDGSCGEQGFVTQHSIWNTAQIDAIFTCGPEPMMKSVAQKAKTGQISCYVSLENTMACGIGACLCCVVETNKGHQCTCTEGPVFRAEDIPAYNI